MKEKIFVLDFGGQYTQLIAKTVRKCNVFSEIVDCDKNVDEIIERKPKGIILSGGPNSVYEEGAPVIKKELLEQDVPILGICYGMQHINHLLDGEIIHGNDVVKEYGETEVFVDNDHVLFSGLEKKIIVWMSHGDSVGELADEFRTIANTKNHVAAIADDKRKIYGVQFHPEVTHTPDGVQIVSNFVHDICGCGNEWTMSNFIDESKKYVQKTVGKNDVIAFASGGVDSSFVATLLSKTEGIGNVYTVYIDALMRKRETEEVERSLKNAGVKNLIIRREENRFIKAIQRMTEPEQKRKTIGNLFGTIQQEVLEELNLDPEKTFLAQGTLYTDTIESGKGVGKRAAKIKSHHNVGCEFIDNLKEKGRIVEPNRLIFKDEVRIAAKEIGLPAEIYKRQPFPGPGLGIRIVSGKCSWVNDEFYVINDKVSELAKEEGLEGYILPIKTVGVQGDKRTYSYLALLRGERDWDRIRSATKKIPTEVHEVNRIVFDVGNNELKKQYLTDLVYTTVNRETVDLLKEIDYEGRKIISNYGFDENISQTIFVLFGADINSNNKRGVALRAVSTDDFMTVSPVEPVDIEKGYKNNIKMSWQCLDEIYGSLKKYNVGAFVIDVTDKPPSTTCWE